MALIIKAINRKAVTIGSVMLLAVACAGGAGCHHAERTTSNFQAINAKALARTIAMLQKGEGANTQMRVLFYGQSITSHKWTDIAAKNMIRDYPNVNFKFANLAIGGNAASLLKRAVARDIDEFYPDLVVFHVYGGEKDYNHIIETIRSRSAAEVILQTDHLTARPEPLCPVGLNVTFRTPPGCVGRFWLHQNHWDDYMSGAIIPKTAARFEAAIDPRRADWSKYLVKHNIEPSQLLQDGVHPNDQGWRVAAALFTTFLNRTIKTSSHETQNLVRVIRTDNRTLKNFSFEGNRLEIISSQPLPKYIKAAVDGVASEKLPGCWIATRVTSIPWIPEWPAIRQVSVSNDRLEADSWTIKIDQLSDDLTKFRFRLYSKLRGFDGEGNGSKDFISNSGSIKIAANDWVLGYAMKVRPVSKPQTLNIHWSRRNLCSHKSDKEAKVGPMEYHYVVATGLQNGGHIATISVPQNYDNSITAFMSYKPWSSQ